MTMKPEIKEMLKSETHINESNVYYIVYTSSGTSYYIDIEMLDGAEQSVGKIYDKLFNLVGMDWQCGTDDDTIESLVDYLTKDFDINEIRWFDEDVFKCMKSR